jgi:hypothetical protein
MSAQLELEVEQEAPPIDRSSIEAWAECPHMAAAMERGEAKPYSMVLEAGNEVHRCLSEATRAMIENDEWYNLREYELAKWMTGVLEEEICHARPDLQPEVIRAMRTSINSWGWFIAKEVRDPRHVLVFDGGDGKRSGQLARDLPGASVRPTSEIDLLFSTPSEKMVREVDYKSGHKIYTAQDVADSLQFQMHAWLIFEQYPNIECVEVEIWNTRINRRTFSVKFWREQEPQIETRLRNALLERAKWQNAELADVPCWPVAEKCATCPAAYRCPAPDQAVRDIADNPDEYIDALHALDQQLNGRIKLARTWMNAQGKTDYITKRGNGFGIGKPKKPKPPTLKLYTSESEESDGGGNGEE